MSDYDRLTPGVLVILIPVHVNLAKERDLEKLMLYDGVTWQEKLGRAKALASGTIIITNKGQYEPKSSGIWELSV
ncbi:hypothetical protein YC2023_078124 [Brassica napus]